MFQVGGVWQVTRLNKAVRVKTLQINKVQGGVEKAPKIGRSERTVASQKTLLSDTLKRTNSTNTI